MILPPSTRMEPWMVPAGPAVRMVAPSMIVPAGAEAVNPKSNARVVADRERLVCIVVILRFRGPGGYVELLAVDEDHGGPRLLGEWVVAINDEVGDFAGVQTT